MTYEYGKRYEVSGEQNAAALIHEMTSPRLGAQTVELDFGDEGTERVRIEGSDPGRDLITFERDRSAGAGGGTEFIRDFPAHRIVAATLIDTEPALDRSDEISW